MSTNTNNPEPSSLATFTVCADSELSEMVTNAADRIPGLEFVGGFPDYLTADRKPHFSSAIKHAGSGLAIIDFDRHAEHAIETASVLSTHQSPRIISVGVSSRIDSGLLLKAMRAGCSEFLEKPLGVTRVQEALQQIQQRFVQSLGTSGKRGRVATIVGIKGGVGATTLSVHLATYLVKVHGKKTLLIDHHDHLGHVCLYLGLKENNYHFEELIRNVDRLDADLLAGFVVRHTNGLEVLASPSVCATPFTDGRGQLEQVLDCLRQEYDCVLFDSSVKYEQTAASIIPHSDEVFLVATPDVAAIRDLSRYIESLQLNEASANLRIIINRGSPGDALGRDQIEKAVGLPVHLTIPNNYIELQRSINAGEPISSQLRSDFTMTIDKWASRLAGVDKVAQVSVAKKLLSFWR